MHRVGGSGGDEHRSDGEPRDDHGHGHGQGDEHDRGHENLVQPFQRAEGADRGQDRRSLVDVDVERVHGS